MYDNDNIRIAAHLEDIFNQNIIPVVARTTIVDINGQIVYDKYVDYEASSIYWTCNYYSGIHQKFYNKQNPKYHKVGDTDIDESRFSDLHDARLLINKSYNNKIFVGHGLINSDFPAMGIQVLDVDVKTHLLSFIHINNIRDTSIYYGEWVQYNRFGPLKRRKLKVLVKQYLNIDIQIEGVSHDPAEDARSALALYLLNKNRYDRLFNNNMQDLASLQDPHYDVKNLREIILRFPSAEGKIMKYRGIRKCYSYGTTGCWVCSSGCR